MKTITFKKGVLWGMVFFITSAMWMIAMTFLVSAACSDTSYGWNCNGCDGAVITKGYPKVKQAEAECIRKRGWAKYKCENLHFSKNCSVGCIHEAGCGSCECRCKGANLYCADITSGLSQSCNVDGNSSKCVPSAKINAPINKQKFIQGEDINFSGEGIDPNNDNIEVYQWILRTVENNTNKDYTKDIRVNGKNFSKNDLAIGEYYIFFRVIDSTEARSTWGRKRIIIESGIGVCSSIYDGGTFDNLTASDPLCSTGTVQNFQTTDTPGWKWQCNNSGKLSDWCEAQKNCGQCPTGNVGALCGEESGVSPNCALGSTFVPEPGSPEMTQEGEVYSWTWKCKKNDCNKECKKSLDLREITLKVSGVFDTDVSGVPTIKVNQAEGLDKKFTLEYTTPEEGIGANCILTGKIGEENIFGPKTVTSNGNVEVTANKTGKYDFKLDCKCAQGDFESIDVTRNKTVNVLCDANPSAWSACSSSCQGTKTREVTDSWTCTKSSETIKCGDENCEGGTIEK